MSLTLAAIGGAAALGSSIYSAIRSNRENKKAQQLISKQKKDNEAWYQRRMASDYTMRSDAQAVLQKQRELLNEQYKRAKAANVVSGGTDNALAIQKQAAANSTAETMSNIAANAAADKDRVEAQYRQTDAALTQQQAQTHQQHAQAIAQAGAQAAGAGINLMANELGTVKPEDTSNVDAINQQVEAMTQKFNQSMEDLKKKSPLFPNN